jgi:serine/threonine-protein kinase HipA
MNTAFVHIWGKTVGAVAWDESTACARFEYTESFRQTGWEVSPLMMPLPSSQQVYSFPGLVHRDNDGLDTFKGLPGLLADVLPDRYGSELINMWLAQQGRTPSSVNPVELLCFIGSRGMGALEFEPATVSDSKSYSLDVEQLVELAGRVLSNKESFSTNLRADEQEALLSIVRIGTSAGGARPKAVIAYNSATAEVRSGQSNAPRGFEHWLMKFDGLTNSQFGDTHGYGRVEMAYFAMASACGVHMMPCQLLEENGRAHFMTKRFDREGGSTRHHVQTLCALKHFDYNLINSFSYEQVFQTMRELRLSYQDAEQMFRRMVFNVMARNCDDHTKNISFLMPKNEAWKLAPAYDVCYAYDPHHKWVSHHALSINGKRNDIQREDLLIVAKSIGCKSANEIIDEVRDSVGAWKDFADTYKVSPELRDAIGSTLLRL